MKLLHAESGEYTGDIHITSDAELFALAPLLDHLTVATRLFLCTIGRGEPLLPKRCFWRRTVWFFFCRAPSTKPLRQAAPRVHVLRA